MRGNRLIQAISLFLVLTGVLWALPTNLPAAKLVGGAPCPMPPHPRLLEQWQAGDDLPPFLEDPTFFQERGVNQVDGQPSGLTGPLNALAVVIDFDDNIHTVTASYFDSLIFDPPVSGRGSVWDYFDEVSYGQVDIVAVDLPSSIGWVRAPQNYSYYVNGIYCFGGYPQNCQKLAEDIVDAVNDVVDFSDYDNDGDGYMEPIMLVHAGPGYELTGNPNHIWSHSWNLAIPRNYDGVTIQDYVIMPEYWTTVSPTDSDMTVGVFAHEMGHGFWDLPDLYDYDASSYGVGDWSLMAGGAWNGPNSGGWGTDGSSPAWPDAWSRLWMGFDAAVHVLGPMSAVFPPVEANQNAVARLESSALIAPEYFLLENRQKLPGTYDEYLPAGGLFIWHIDDTLAGGYGPNSNECRSIPHCSGACASSGSHYLVALEQADGYDHLEYKANQGDLGDPFPGSTGRTYWQPYFANPGVNPESGSWYDSNCVIDSCIDITEISCSPLADCTASINRALCAGDQVDADLGDAPASENSLALSMTAYFPTGPLPGVQARFPSVYLPAPNAPGPRHFDCQADSWLGAGVTAELNADWPPDEDGTTNISPTLDVADLDSSSLFPGYDDGVFLPLPLTPCISTSLSYTVTVASGGPTFRYVNAWFDWNRDGDWADTLTCTGGVPAAEWAVPDEPTNLGQGVHPRVSGPFIPYIAVVEGAPFEAWMRLSIAEQPAPAPHDGRGPAPGYAYGETEDYYLFLDPWLGKRADLSVDPAPGELLAHQIMYSGTGNVIAGATIISDVLPAGVEYAYSDPPGAYDPGSRTVTWMTSLQPGYLEAITLVVTVTGSPGDTVTNTAYLLWADSIWTRSSFSFTIGAGCAPGDPQAAFTVTKSVCTGEVISLTNQTSGTVPLSFAWDLDGDGQPDSTDEHPVWQYDAAGDYTVTLTATNACSQSVYSDVVTVLPSLAGVAISGPLSLEVDEEGFYQAIVEPITATNPSYLWSSGATGSSTVYSWTVPGTYTVAVTATNCQNTVVSDSIAVLVTERTVFYIYLPLVVRSGG